METGKARYWALIPFVSAGLLMSGGRLRNAVCASVMACVAFWLMAIVPARATFTSYGSVQLTDRANEIISWRFWVQNDSGNVSSIRVDQPVYSAGNEYRIWYTATLNQPIIDSDWQQFECTGSGRYWFEVTEEGGYQHWVYYIDVNFEDGLIKIEGGDGDPPVPQPGDPPPVYDEDSSWWDWLKSLFTLSEETQADIDAVKEDFMAAGPWGMAAGLADTMDVEGSTLGWSAIENWTFWRQNPRQDLGDVGSWDATPATIPWITSSATYPLEGQMGGSELWSFNDSVWDWRDDFRTILQYGLWAGFGIMILKWSKGQVSV